MNCDSKYSNARPDSVDSKEKISSSESNQKKIICCVYKINTSGYYRNVPIYNHKKENHYLITFAFST